MATSAKSEIAKKMMEVPLLFRQKTDIKSRMALAFRLYPRVSPKLTFNNAHMRRHLLQGWLRNISTVVEGSAWGLYLACREVGLDCGEGNSSPRSFVGGF